MTYSEGSYDFEVAVRTARENMRLHGLELVGEMQESQWVSTDSEVRSRLIFKLIHQLSAHKSMS